MPPRASSPSARHDFITKLDRRFQKAPETFEEIISYTTTSHYREGYKVQGSVLHMMLEQEHLNDHCGPLVRWFAHKGLLPKMVKQRDSEGQTPLDLLLHKLWRYYSKDRVSHTQVAESWPKYRGCFIAMLEAGADVSAKNPDHHHPSSMTPLDYATTHLKSYNELLELMESHRKEQEEGPQSGGRNKDAAMAIDDLDQDEMMEKQDEDDVSGPFLLLSY